MDIKIQTNIVNLLCILLFSRTLTMHVARSLQQIQPSYIREILTAAKSPDVISLAGGLPCSEHFPMNLMTKSIQRLSNLPAAFQYNETQGYPPLLDYIKSKYALPEQHQALICTGSQQALDLIARSFINQNDKIVVEAPSYLGALQVFALAQANILSVEQTNEGPNLNQLAQTFAQHKVKMFYAVPDFHNPTGVCWSLACRKHVAELCIKYSVTLIEDAPYRPLRFSGDPLPMVSTFCPDNALVLRSFSKIAAPGMRLGVVTGPSKWVTHLIKIKQASDLHSSIPMQVVLLDLLQNIGFTEHLSNIRALYKSRYQCLSDNLKQGLPTDYRLNSVQGGMFIWLRLPTTHADKINVNDIAKKALESKVAVVPSSVFYLKEQTAQPALRLNFSHTHLDKLHVATKRLIKVLKG